MKQVKSILAAALAFYMCLSMAGCGESKKSIDDMTEEDFEQALMEIDGMSDKEFEQRINSGSNNSASSESVETAAASYMAKLIHDCAASYSVKLQMSGQFLPEDFNILKNELISEGYFEKKGKFETTINGKSKKVKWNMDDADVTGKMNNGIIQYVTVTADGVSCTYPEGADKLEAVDAFSNLTVTFNGIYPDSSISISGGDSRVTYKASTEKNMKNGDIVTISAELNSSYSTQCMLTESSKEYTVEGLSAYVTSISEIPEEMKEKMLAQANDSITASCAGWAEGNTLKSLEFAGFYLLTGKEGFHANPYNRLYCVYKSTANVTGYKRGGDGKTEENADETYYTYYRFNDIMLLPDGVCSVDLSGGEMTSNRIESDYGYYDFWGGGTFYTFKGYKDLDSMFNECVTSQIEKYNYESTVE